MSAQDSIAPDSGPEATRLNQNCYCITLDRDALGEAIERETSDPNFYADHVGTRTNLFSNVPVFLAASAFADMRRVVAAIEAATRLPYYRQTVLAWAPEIARPDHGPIGAFMGYDFHLEGDVARLIEVNTNAGGAFLNAMLARAQRACCFEVEQNFDLHSTGEFDASVLRMFQKEWRLQRGTSPLKRIAIVDDQPQDQYLYPEFVIAQQVLAKAGLDVIIAGPDELVYEGGQLLGGGSAIDLVYNRLVDFSLALPEHEALRAAYVDGAVVVTPNPHNHALFADKRNLTLLSDRATLSGWGLSDEHSAALAGVPHTSLVTPDNADALWAARKGLFFKPTSGYGGKAVYRGDKVTKGVWADIERGGYIAQAFAAPGERMIKLDGEEVVRKMDIRLFTYDGGVLLAAARLYQGQTTNFRTPGGGFAPVFAV